MKYGRSRLDVFVRRRLQWSQSQVRECLILGCIKVDGVQASSMSQVIGPFSHVAVNGRIIADQKPIYVLLNKPKGVVSATKDLVHVTVLDVINFWHIKYWTFSPACYLNPLLKPLNYSLQQYRINSHLHIAGRLDYNSTGVVLLTNDGRWSKALSLPGERVPKKYRVILEEPLSDDYVQAFAQGIYFPYEGLTTLPAQLFLLGQYEAEVILVEGRYHQIKRMFGAFNNKVLQLHRTAVGNIKLDGQQKVGQWRYLSQEEVERV